MLMNVTKDENWVYLPESKYILNSCKNYFHRYDQLNHLCRTLAFQKWKIQIDTINIFKAPRVDGLPAELIKHWE